MDSIPTGTSGDSWRGRNRSGGTARRLLGSATAVALVLVVAGVVRAQPAVAGVGLGTTPELPASVKAGDTGVPGSLRIRNEATGGEGQDSATLTDITLVPSCSLSPAAPPDVNCTGGEDAAFTLSATAAGVAGTACAGRTFTVAVIDAASGRHRFTPDQPVVLGAPGSATDTCGIAFTFDVARLPAKDAFPNTPGLQTTQVAFSAATFAPSELTGSGTGTDVTTVRAVPAITTQAPPTGEVGDPVSDVATLTGGQNPGGTITFKLFGPGDEQCTGAPVFTSEVPVNGNGTYTSGSFTPMSAGTYRWVAAYSGDAGNAAVTMACGEANEITAVVETTTTTTTTTSTTTTTTAPPGPTTTAPAAPTTTVPPAPTTTVAVAVLAQEAVRGGQLPRTGMTVLGVVALAAGVIAVGALMVGQQGRRRRRPGQGPPGPAGSG
ncbi:MAG TPA: Ig-like domain-containing protein [Acidimicrobiales bacterium]|nr:Ig-like domain-containing protein [Acidimicrobiales bacterium]